MISWHRFYDPSTGRYISADPIGLTGGMNLYAYVGGNPVNAIDPRGLHPRCGRNDCPLLPPDWDPKAHEKDHCMFDCKVTLFKETYVCKVIGSYEHMTCQNELVMTKKCLDEAKDTETRCVQKAKDDYKECIKKCECEE